MTRKFSHERPRTGQKPHKALRERGGKFFKKSYMFVRESGEIIIWPTIHELVHNISMRTRCTQCAMPIRVNDPSNYSAIPAKQLKRAKK